jgi:DNA-binding NarL/FixJ family response regulator
MIPILLVDDHHIIVSAISTQLSEYWPNCPVVTTSTLAEAKRLVSVSKFTLIVLDLSLPDSVGVQSVYALRSAAPNVDIIVYTGFVQLQLAEKCLEAGAYAFVSKADHRDVLLKVISRRLGNVSGGSEDTGSERLTVRQQQVLKYLLKGLAVKEIVTELGIAESTVQTHIRTINQIGGAKNRMELARWAASQGYDT